MVVIATRNENQWSNRSIQPKVCIIAEWQQGAAETPKSHRSHEFNISCLPGSSLNWITNCCWKFCPSHHLNHLVNSPTSCRFLNHPCIFLILNCHAKLPLSKLPLKSPLLNCYAELILSKLCLSWIVTLNWYTLNWGLNYSPESSHGYPPELHPNL